MGRVGGERGEIQKKKHPAKKMQEIHAQRARHKEQLLHRKLDPLIIRAALEFSNLPCDNFCNGLSLKIPLLCM